MRYLAIVANVADAGTLREVAEQQRDKLGEQSIVLVASSGGGKATLVLTVSKALTDRIKAGDLIRPVAAVVGGGGGGRPDMAQAGGPNADKLGEAQAIFYDEVTRRLETL